MLYDEKDEISYEKLLDEFRKKSNSNEKLDPEEFRKKDLEALKKIAEIVPNAEIVEKELIPFNPRQILINKEKNSMLIIEPKIKDDVNYIITIEEALKELDPSKKTHVILDLEFLPKTILDLFLFLSDKDIELYVKEFDELIEYLKEGSIDDKDFDDKENKIENIRINKFNEIFNRDLGFEKQEKEN